MMAQLQTSPGWVSRCSALARWRIGGESARRDLPRRTALVIGSLLVVTSWLPLASATVGQPAREVGTSMAPPPLSAQAAFVIDASVGTELYALNPDEPRSPASLTKVATALVVLDHADLDDLVTIEEEDRVDLLESHVGPNGLAVGDQLSVRDLLAGLLIPSGNDAARALARHVGGALLGGEPTPVAARLEFVDEMNRLVAEMGLRNTQFTNPTGIDDPGRHYASARDLALLSAKAMENALIREIVATREMVLPSELVPGGYPIFTTNDLLLEGAVDGIKTGTTPDAGGCLISSTEISGNRVISVVLGSETTSDENGTTISPARFDDVRTMMAAIGEDYRWFDPTMPEAVAGLIDELDVWDSAIPAGPSLVIPAARAADLRYRLQLGPPTAPNEQVGKVLFFVGSDLLSERPVLQAAS